MNKKMSKRQRDIKTKLMAAVCMLLVSSIMMVSTTYAWFTLSTAPEVTGITTAVGANGNLEMALVPVNGNNESQANDYGITTGTSDSMAVKEANESNVTWGNLVDLQNYYGLNKITLYPTALNLVEGDINVDGSILSFPKYGSDGRISELSSNTVTGVYDTVLTNFYQSGKIADSTAEGGYAAVADPAGVRVVGTVSGMSQRQTDQRNALAAANAAMKAATTKASTTLANKGPTLAGIAVKYAMNNSAATYSQTEIGVMKDIVSDLKIALESVETAYRQLIYAREIAINADYANVAAAIVGSEGVAPTLSIADLKTQYATEEKGLADLAAMLDKLTASMGKVTSANNELGALTGDSITWGQISGPLSYIANKDNMSVNGKDVDDVTKSYVMAEYAKGNGINLVLNSGSGIFADIADHCGDYGSGIDIPASAAGLLEAGEEEFYIRANMSTKSSVIPYYLSTARSRATATEVPGEADTSTKPISDYYGYIIDLAFRTNASDSYLCLQTDAVDRIYTDGTTTDTTMGGGSTMTFTKVDPSFDDSSMQNLMKHIRIVFFNPETGDIYAYGVMDTEPAEIGSSIKKGIVLASVPNPTEASHYIAGNQLLALEQNQAHRVSVLVYLDGTTITNADVAVGAAQSMTGSLNLQFSSTAELVPMQYTDLVDATSNTGITTLNIKSISTGYEATAMHHRSGILAALITKDGAAVTNSDATVTIQGKAATYETFNGASAWVVGGVVEAPADGAEIVVTPKTTSEPEEEEGGDDDQNQTTTYTVGLATDSLADVTLSENAAAATANTAYTFKLTAAEGVTVTSVSYTVDGTDKGTLDASAEGVYTIPAENVTGAILIKVS